MNYLASLIFKVTRKQHCLIYIAFSEDLVNWGLKFSFSFFFLGKEIKAKKQKEKNKQLAKQTDGNFSKRFILTKRADAKHYR